MSSGKEDLAPRITLKPSLKQEDNGNKLLIFCECEASPMPEVKWFKDNAAISTGAPRMKIRSDETAPRTYRLCLEIDNVTSDDSGQFKMVAKNRLGEVAASIALNFAGMLQLALFLVFFLFETSFSCLLFTLLTFDNDL